MATLSFNETGDLSVTLRGAVEDAVLTTLRRWPHWRHAAVERDPQNASRCIAVTLIADRQHEPTIREILKRGFGMIFPAEGGSQEMVVTPPTVRSRQRA